MSTETLSGLRDYLFSTLSRSNMLWLATQLKERAISRSSMKIKWHIEAKTAVKQPVIFVVSLMPKVPQILSKKFIIQKSFWRTIPI